MPGETKSTSANCVRGLLLLSRLVIEAQFFGNGAVALQISNPGARVRSRF